MKRRTLLSAVPAIALGASLRARAEGTRKYVVMSVVSDQLNYANAPGRSTGTMMQRTVTTPMPLAGAPFDRTAMEVLAGEVPHAVPGAELIFLAASGANVYSGHEGWFDGDRLTLPASMRGSIEKEAPGALLLLVTKIRDRTKVSDGREVVGVGQLEGLGVYRDRAHVMRAEVNAETFYLFAPFVYIRLSLVDVASWKVMRHDDIELAKPVYAETMSGVYASIQQQLIEGLRTAVGVVLKDA